MKRIISASLGTLILLLFCGFLDAQMMDEGNFFSYKKFFINTHVLDRVKGTDLTRRNLKEFAMRFSEAIHFLTIGRDESAKDELFKARRLWPEYFGTDFLLALAYENTGDFPMAARFYKSYLIKLKNYRDGNYPISGPIIDFLGEGRVEDYNTAHYLVKDRLLKFGIDLDTVKPVAASSNFLIYLLALFFFAGIYLVIFYVVIPYVRIQSRIKHTPEGFWVCKNCGASSPVLSKVCNGCGRPRK